MSMKRVLEGYNHSASKVTWEKEEKRGVQMKKNTERQERKIGKWRKGGGRFKEKNPYHFKEGQFL